MASIQNQDLNAHPVCIRLRDSNGSYWSGVIFPSVVGEQGRRFKLTCEEVRNGDDVEALFPNHSDLIAKTGPNHIAVLKSILRTFTSSFGGMEGGGLLPKSVNGICRDLIEAPDEFEESRDVLTSASFPADVALDILDIRLHNLSPDWNVANRQASYKREIGIVDGMALSLDFDCSIGSYRCGLTQFKDQCTAELVFDKARTHDDVANAIIRTRLLLAFLSALPLSATQATLTARNKVQGRTSIANERAGAATKERGFPLWSEKSGPLGFDTVWKTFEQSAKRLIPPMAATLICLHKSRNLDERSFATFPTLEKLLGNDFKEPDEINFIERQDEYFSWLGQKPELLDFARKHVKIVGQKNPGLDKRFQRLADHLNSLGAKFPADTGTLLASIRNTRFHSHTVGTENTEYYRGQITATALMAFRVFDLLGLPPAVLSKGTLPAEFHDFLQAAPQN